MHTPLRVLIIEDSEDDCLLLKNELTRASYAVTYQRVDTAETMQEALAEKWDIVVSDHRMPQFSSGAALKLFKERELNIPFIVVSGSIGEELAVGAMRAGAHDYIMKDNLARLVPAVERELREAESRRQRRNAEEQLKAYRRRTESILEAAGEGICGLDADGVINFINPRGAKLMGWDATQVIGKPLHETFHHSRADHTPFPKEDCSLCATLRDGLAHWMDDEVFWRKDGTSIPIEYTCMPIHGDNQLVGAVLTFQDITQRKFAEGALREANQRLEASLLELRRTQQQVVEQERLRALGRMAGGVAHDFNNTLSKILGFTELLLTSSDKLSDTSTVRDHLRMINTVSQDAARVVRRLHDFHRPRRDTEIFDAIDLNNLVEETVSVTDPKLRHHTTASLSIRVRLELQPKVLACAAEQELRDVLANLVSNAIDAMPKGGTLTFRTSADKAWATLEISDTGIGMTEEIQRRCFEPFFTTKENGAGLGLASTYGIIQRHRGEIQIRSEIGRGTTFTIRLPVKPSQREEAPVAEPVAAPKNKALHVLVVEDEPMVRKIEVEYLTADGHVVETASDGCDGLSRFRSGKFDLVVVDRAMPEINGDQLTEAIKELNPRMPVILVTGFTDASESEATERQPDLVLAKPFSHASLRSAVEKVMAAA